MYNDLDQDVGEFVEMIWNEATQEAEKMLTVSMQHTKVDKVVILNLTVCVNR